MTTLLLALALLLPLAEPPKVPHLAQAKVRGQDLSADFLGLMPVGRV
jgi:hypothetical protein